MLSIYVSEIKMRALFIICVTLTIVQVLDFYNAGVLADGNEIPNYIVSSNEDTKTFKSRRQLSINVKSSTLRNQLELAQPIVHKCSETTDSKTDSKALNNVKKASSKSVARALNDNKKTSSKSKKVNKVNDEDSENELISSNSLYGSGKNLIKTIGTETKKGGVGTLNGLTGMVKMTSGSVGFFGNLVKEQSNNVRRVSKESFGLLSSLGNTTTNGKINVIHSIKEIGQANADSLHRTLKKSTDLGVNVSKLGGTMLETPISIGSDVVNIGNRVARIPQKISKLIANKTAQLPLLKDSEEDNENVENDEV